MSDSQKKKKEPTIWHAVGAGAITVVVLLVIFYSIGTPYPPQPKSIANFLELFTPPALPIVLFCIFGCTIGAYIGKSRRKSFPGLWIGAILGLIASEFFILIWAFLNRAD